MRKFCTTIATLNEGTDIFIADLCRKIRAIIGMVSAVSVVSKSNHFFVVIKSDK